ncbi:MAG TPA: hypothetical protein VNT53_09180 [Pseudolysinimonas sp.]|nr:hypothetical protein [Pseudolysinimonas sp.]
MTHEKTATSTRIATVGLGQQGQGIARLLEEAGYQLVGGVDIGDKVGKKISDFANGVTGEATVYGSVTELISAVDDLDVIVLAAAISLEITVGQAREAFEAGINVLTLQPDLFEPTPDWADELQAIGEKTGASLLATGVQDPWWVQMPSVAAASTVNIRSVQVEHLIDLESIAAGIMTSIGVNVPASEFGPYQEGIEALPPILGGPLRLAAVAMGMVPGEVSAQIVPYVAESDVRWNSGDTVIPAGNITGYEEVTTFTTDAGVEFRGFLRLRPLVGDEVPSDELTIDGDPSLHLRNAPFPGQQVTNIALVARIPDIIAAPGGVHSPADLGPARYRPPVAR